MASRTNQAIDRVTLLHTGQSTVNCAGFSDPAGAPWLVMNDTAAAVQGLEVTNAAANGTVTLSVAGATADTNAAVKLVGRGTGAVVLGSSVSAVTLAGAPTISSNLAITGTLTANAATITTLVAASTVSASGPINAFVSASTGVAVAAFLMGSSGPRIFYGASAPTSSARPGDIFLNLGGSSTTGFSIGIPNGNTASSSNWVNYTPI